jgi:hypothetical protein
VVFLIFLTITPPSQSYIFAQAQKLRVGVGAVTKYSGSLSSSGRQRCQDFLDVLETQLAADFVKSPDVEYLDRSNLDEVFRELDIPSDVAFDASTGALRGLLGRLDYLIVAESSSPSSARVRVIDVETGAVKVATICQPRTSLFGGLSTEAPECIPSIVAQTSSLAKARLALKRQRLMKAAAAEQAAEERRAELAKREREEESKRAQQELIAAQQRDEEQRAAQERQAEIEHQINAVRPRYEEAVARLSAEAAFWKQLNEELRSRGGSLRPAIQSALKSAHLTADRCGEFLTAGKPDELNTCISELSRKLDRLEEYK